MAVLANEPIGTIADQQSNYRILADADVVNAASATWVHLNDGGKLWLGSESRGIFHKNRLTLEKGRARLNVREGYEVQARGVSLYPKGPLSTATVGFLNNGNLAVGVWEGSLRIAAGSTVLENVMPGEILEFAPPQTTGSTGSPGGGGPMPGGGLAGPCPAQICVNGPISYEGNGDTLKAFITDETTGAKIELVGAAANLQARGVKAGTRLIVAGTVASRAAPQIIPG
ncbi:MAG: hypothetical protein M3Y27_26595 [Acidobacteriota bacterium]|nr:hypothetical protein [Acidobacteriota bacterium]